MERLLTAATGWSGVARKAKEQAVMGRLGPNGLKIF